MISHLGHGNGLLSGLPSDSLVPLLSVLRKTTRMRLLKYKSDHFIPCSKPSNDFSSYSEETQGPCKSFCDLAPVTSLSLQTATLSYHWWEEKAEGSGSGRDDQEVMSGGSYSKMLCGVGCVRLELRGIPDWRYAFGSCWHTVFKDISLEQVPKVVDLAKDDQEWRPMEPQNQMSGKKRRNQQGGLKSSHQQGGRETNRGNGKNLQAKWSNLPVNWNLCIKGFCLNLDSS